MPAPIVAALIGLAGTGVTTGLEAAGTFQPSTTAANQQAQLAAKEAQQKQQQDQLQQAFKRFAPNAQAQAPGLSEGGMAELIATMAGQPGDIGTAQQTVFGTPAGSTPGLDTAQQTLNPPNNPNEPGLASGGGLNA